MYATCFAEESLISIAIIHFQANVTNSPPTVLQKILLGALKWNGPREGLVFIFFRRKARYFTVEG